MSNSNRILEAYVGEYASGKSEVAINRALSLVNGEPVTLVDLDLVEPFYTLRPLKDELTQCGLHVVAWKTTETLGIGETGMIMKPEARWALKRVGNVILDVGYGAYGTTVLNLLEGYPSAELKVLVVINVARPMTSTVDDITSYLNDFKQIDGLINNSNLGDKTDLSVIRRGVEIVSKAGVSLGLPVVATTVEKRFQCDLGEADHYGNPVHYLTRYMQRAFW